MYALVLTTGMRQGEILALTWENVDLPGCRLRVEQTLTDVDGCLRAAPPKTSSSRRTIELPAITVDAFNDLRRTQSSPVSGWVFPDASGGPRRKSNLIRRSFKPLLRAAGLLGVPFHTLRHVANSVLLTQGGNIKVAAERLGHATTRMTMDVYAHVLPTAQRAAADRIDGAFAEIGVKLGSTPRGRQRCPCAPGNEKARWINTSGLSGPYGGEETRTPDPLHAKQVLYQLSYTPTGRPGFYQSTSPAVKDPSVIQPLFWKAFVRKRGPAAPVGRSVPRLPDVGQREASAS